MLKIRLSRIGKRVQPSFRIIVQEHTASPKGKFIDVLGYYRPTQNPKEFKVDQEKVKEWIVKGAQPSDALAVLLKNEGMSGMDKYIEPRNKKRKGKKAQEEAPAQPAAAPKAEAPAETPKAETPAEEPAQPAETPQEAPKEEPKEEAPKQEEPKADPAPAAEAPQSPKEES